MKNQDIQINVKKTGYGNFDVTVYDVGNLKGTFYTTDSQLIDDISEMNKDGFESELVMHSTFDEVIETCLSRL